MVSIGVDPVQVGMPLMNVQRADHYATPSVKKSAFK